MIIIVRSYCKPDLEISMASLNDPLDLPSGLRLPNRIAKAALSEALGDSDNSPDERIVTLYRRWAQGGYGLLVTGNIMVDRAHLGEPGNIVIEDDRALPQLTAWTKAAHDGGATIVAQLNHPGPPVEPAEHRPPAGRTQRRTAVSARRGHSSRTHRTRDRGDHRPVRDRCRGL
jgi:2,4-dienoyl-CoA reductase-like NADH-dependent reductase (Old Yellow Enzyme family)